jgi:hypothetical protein
MPQIILQEGIYGGILLSRVIIGIIIGIPLLLGVFYIILSKRNMATKSKSKINIWLNSVYLSITAMVLMLFLVLLSLFIFTLFWKAHIS